MIQHRWNQIEADFARYYHVDPMTLSARRLLVLFDGLPAGALSRGEEHWGDATMLAVLQLEMLDAMLRQLKASAGAKKRDLGKPLQIPRPGFLRPEKGSAADRLRRFASSMRGR